MAIIGEKLKSYVADQIKIRQEKLSPNYIKTDQDLIYFDAKTAWVKMASAVSVEESKLRNLGYDDIDVKVLKGKGLAQKHILFGGIADMDPIYYGEPLKTKQGFGAPSQTFTNKKGEIINYLNPSSYDISKEFGIVPNPGIKDMSVKCLNRGSLKKAKLKIRVENKIQLQIIDLLYLRLGYTVLLEWGNSHYYDNEGKLKNTPITLIEKYFFGGNKNQSLQKLSNNIERYRERLNGNYDGFIGKVSNFNWNFNEDGSYDINLELISLGDVIESLKSNVTLDTKSNDYILNSTSGSTNVTITSTDDPINANRILNSLFSILYLWKDQYKTLVDFTSPTDRVVNGKDLSIKYKNGGDVHEKFIGDVLDPITNDDLTFTTGEYTLTMELGFLKTATATPGDFNTYEFATKNNTLPSYTTQYNNGEYGYYNYQDTDTIKLTYDGTFTGTDKQEILNNIIGASDVIPGDTFSSNTPGIEFIDLKSWLKYFNFNANTLLPSTDPSSTVNLMVDDTSENTAYKNFLNNRDVRILSFQGDSKTVVVHTSQLGETMTIGGSTMLTVVPKNKQQAVLYSNLRNDTWLYPPGDTSAYVYYDGKAANPNSSTGNPFGGFKFNRFNPSSTIVGYNSKIFSKPGVNNKGRFVPFKARVDIPLVKIKLTKRVLTTTTAANPLKKFQKGDVFRLYQTNDGVNTHLFYMRFGALLQTLKNEVISRIDIGENDNSKNPNIVSINNNNRPFITNPTNGKREINPEFKSYMSNKPNLASFDVSKCIVRTPINFAASGTNPAYSYYIFPTSKIRRWWINNSDIEEGGNSMNIYLSFKFIGDVLLSNTDKEGNISVYKFIKGLCDGINRSFANVPNLEPVIDETTNELSIVDSSLNKSEKKGDYQLNPFSFIGGKGCFVRKVDLKTAITPEYATMVTVGATAGGYVKGVEATAFANWNRGLNDRFKVNLRPASDTNSVTRQGQIKDAILSFQKVWLTEPNSSLTSLGISTNENEFGLTPSLQQVGPVTFNSELIETNNQIADEYFKAYQSREGDGSSLGFIPFSVTLKMDGISGVKIYNEILLSTKFLPSNYSANLSFIVTAVDHALKNNDWETTLKLTLIPTPKKGYEEVEVQDFTKRSYTFVKPAVVTPTPGPTPTPTPSITGGPGLDPIKNLIKKVESGNNYDRYNYYNSSGGLKDSKNISGGRANKVFNGVTEGVNFGKGYTGADTQLTSMTITQVLKFQKKSSSNPTGTDYAGSAGPFAAGAFQLIPGVLASAVTKGVVLSTNLYDKTTQDVLGNWLIGVGPKKKRKKLGKYLEGTNGGSQSDLEAAVQDLSYEFASFPTMFRTKNGAIGPTNNPGRQGNVVTGAGDLGYYQGTVNSSTTKIKVADVVQAIIKSRIQYTSNNPSFIPSYYVP